MSTVWMFPGHGSQYVGMGRALAKMEAGRDWLKRAEEIAGRPLASFAARGPLHELTRPSILEPLLVAFGCAAVDLLFESKHEPAIAVGYSAGEVSALYAAGSVDADTCLRIACARGVALECAAEKQPGTLVSVRGLTLPELSVLFSGSVGSIAVAGHHATRLFTVTGLSSAIRDFSSVARAYGAEVTALELTGPWHGPWMGSAQEEIASALAHLSFCAPRFPVSLASHGALSTDPSALRKSLSESVVSPVRWTTLVNALVASGVDDFLDVGPGRTLWALLGQLPLPPLATRRFLERPGGPLRGPLAHCNLSSVVS